MERPGTTEIAFSRMGAPQEGGAGAAGQAGNTALCTTTMQPSDAYQHLDILPHPLCLPQAQELCTSPGSAKGSGAVGLLPFSERQNVAGI